MHVDMAAHCHTADSAVPHVMVEVAVGIHHMVEVAVGVHHMVEVAVGAHGMGCLSACIV